MLRRLERAAPLVALAAFGLASYWALIWRGFVLLGFDALVFFYPLMTYRDRRLRAGELPLWVPDYFLGAPFLANPQTAVLYPPNWLTLGLDASRAYAWQAFGHSLLLAGGGFWLARRVLGVGPLAALTGGLILAFGGYGQSLIGHLNQLQAAAWLPVALVLADRALTRRSLRPAALLGVVLALQFLAGHAQQSYMSIALLGVWLVARAVLDRRPDVGRVASPATPLPLGEGRVRASLPGLLWALAILAAAGVVAVLLAAPQLLPTQEATSQGIRAGGMTYREAVAFSLPPWVLPIGLLPVFTPENQPGSEWQTYVGVVGLVLAAVGVVAGQPRRPALVLGGIALAAFLLALGQFGPLYPVLYRIVPGLGLFRVPARWLFVASFAAAMLAALGLDALRRPRIAADPLRPRPLSLWERVRVRASSPSSPALPAAALLGVLSLPVVVYGLVVRDYPLQLPSAPVQLTWAAVAAAALALAALAPRARWAPPLLVALLAAELLAASWPLDVNRAGPAEAYGAMRPTEAHLLDQLAGAPRPARTLAITDAGFDPGDLDLLRSEVAGLLDPVRVEDWVAAVKHKDALSPNVGLSFGIPSIDGYDGGVLPLRSYVGLKELFPLRAANLSDGRLGIQLERLPPVALLSWLNVGWVVMDRHRDVWVDGVYYDLAVRTPISPGRSVALTGVAANARASAVGLIAWPSGGAGVAAAVVEVSAPDGSTRRAEVRIEGDQAARGRAPIRASLGGIGPVARVSVSSPTGLVLGGLTLVDEANGVDWPVPAEPGLRYTALGDVKVYRNEVVRPRAFLVHGVLPVPDDAAARDALGAELDPLTAVAVVNPPADWAGSAPGPAGPGESVEIVSYQPERVELRARLDRAGALVLTDAAYPGWSATVDGSPIAIQRADGGLRALLLEPGDHTIVFTFVPRSFQIGLALAALGVLLTLALLLSTRLAELPGRFVPGGRA